MHCGRDMVQIWGVLPYPYVLFILLYYIYFILVHHTSITTALYFNQKYMIQAISHLPCFYQCLHDSELHPTLRAFWLLDMMNIYHESDGNRKTWIYQNSLQAGSLIIIIIIKLLFHKNTTVNFKIICFMEK